jgi:tetratricopeptide (TPR) repeat protein
VAKLVAALDQRGDSAKAAQGGIERETIFQLARRIRPEVIGFEQAVKELGNAVGIALDVISRGERGSNQEAFVEDVLKLLAETTKTGDFDSGAKTVDNALAELDRRDTERRAASRRSRETLLEAGVEQDLLRRDPSAVARRIEAIAAMDSTVGNPAWSQKYRERFDRFSAEGENKGSNLSLEVAIELSRRMVASAHNADERAIALNLLGNTLAMLGEWEIGTARLEEAVSAYNEALQERTRARVPLPLGNRVTALIGKFARERAPQDWAITQMNLGKALTTLGERKSGTARLKEAVRAFQEALREFTRERAPLKWAKVQMYLGNALRALGERESGTARLKEAVRAFQEALQEFTRKQVPLDWATAQMNLGTALHVLAWREWSMARLWEATVAYREALKELTRERVPLQWAAAQMNLGDALFTLGERGYEMPKVEKTARLEDAISAYREALKEYSRKRVPVNWVRIQSMLGEALLKLGERESAISPLGNLRDALRCFGDRQNSELFREWEEAIRREGESWTARFEGAVSACREALQEIDRERQPLDWAMNQNTFAKAHLALFIIALYNKTAQAGQLDDALQAVDGALEEFRKADDGRFFVDADRIRTKILAAKDKL